MHVADLKEGEAVNTDLHPSHWSVPLSGHVNTTSRALLDSEHRRRHLFKQMEDKRGSTIDIKDLLKGRGSASMPSEIAAFKTGRQSDAGAWVFYVSLRPGCAVISWINTYVQHKEVSHYHDDGICCY